MGDVVTMIEEWENARTSTGPIHLVQGKAVKLRKSWAPQTAKSVVDSLIKAEVVGADDSVRALNIAETKIHTSVGYRLLGLWIGLGIPLTFVILVDLFADRQNLIGTLREQALLFLIGVLGTFVGSLLILAWLENRRVKLERANDD